MDLTEVWKDQREFNARLRKSPEDFEGRSRLTRDLALHMHSEVGDLLRHVKWKGHRKETLVENPAAIREELADLFKMLISIAQVWDCTPEQLVEAYWRKSMVCQQRYSEEWVQDLMRPSVLIDIDNVLGDYTYGILDWIARVYPQHKARCADLRRGDSWVDAAAMGVEATDWEQMKHRFRTEGGKLDLPVIPGALEFLKRCQESGYLIILLTSRPIDQYPNIFTDTLQWLDVNGLPYDAVWWASNKRDLVISQGIKDKVAVFVDDQWHYAKHMSDLGIPSVWFRPRGIEVSEHDGVRQWAAAGRPVTIHDDFSKITLRSLT